jgi:hypothetical protein
MNDVSEIVLANIEALLVGERASPREALLAAYELGHLDGRIEMSRIGEQLIKEAFKEKA